MPEELRQLLPFIVVLFMLVWVVWIGRRRARRMRRAESSETQAATSSRHRLQRAMEELQINVMEFSRDVEGRLDTRMRALEHLIREADERIERLEGLSSGGNSHSGGEAPAEHAAVYRLADSGVDKVEIARRTGMQPGEIDLILGLRKSRGG